MHFRQRRADRFPVERDGLARVSGQDERLGAEGEETLQGAVELSRLLAEPSGVASRSGRPTADRKSVSPVKSARPSSR